MNETTQQNRLFDNKKLAALLIPLAVDQLLNSFMGTVDTLVVSNLGSAAISAVSLVDSINILIVQAFFALASGGTVVCSHYLGCGKKEHAQEAARQLVFITFVLSAVIAGMCLLFNGPMLALIFGKVESAVMVNAKKYFFFSAISYPFIALYDDGSCILRAQENSRLPMLISVISNILNIILNLLFVWVFHWGVAGSATATMLARMFSMVTVLVKLRNPQLEIQLRKYFTIRPDWDEIKRILRIGVPSGVENSMFQLGKLAIQSTVSLMGTAAIAAQGMASIIENLNGIMGIGIGIGLMTVVGKLLEQEEKEEAVYYVKRNYVLFRSSDHCILSAFVCFSSSDYLFWRYGAGKRKTLYFHGNVHNHCKAIDPVMAFCSAYGFRAAGDVKFTMTVSMLTMWLCRVTSLLFLRVFGFGPIAVWIGMFSDWALRGVIFTIRFRNRKWLNHHVI